jgi:hypothetical protein
MDMNILGKLYKAAGHKISTCTTVFTVHRVRVILFEKPLISLIGVFYCTMYIMYIVYALADAWSKILLKA